MVGVIVSVMGVIDSVVIESMSEAMIAHKAIFFLCFQELCHNRLHVLSHSNVIQRLLQVLRDLRVSVALSQVLGGGEVVTDSLEEFGHRDVVVGKVLRDSDVVLGLLKEFSHCYIVLREEFSNRDVIRDLIKELSNGTIKKLGRALVVCRAQILQYVLHDVFAIESV